MVRELITIQVGQCGNQVGCRFWDLALAEHSKAAEEAGGGRERERAGPVYDDALSSFFTNVDSRSGRRLDVGSRLASLRARAVLVDMEEGVVNSIAASPLGELFEAKQFITDQSGSGNNWAHGHAMYGPQYADALAESIRVQAEACDSLQSFFSLHSMGGGTGSGLGTFILNLLADEYPSVYRFTTAVFPSPDDDVVTSPYNSVLAAAQLVEHADCVLPLENASLLSILSRIEVDLTPRERARRKADSALTDAPDYASDSSASSSAYVAGTGGAVKKKKARAFDKMNNIAARLLLNLTASMRFEGSLNVDLNEVTMNLVPFPRLHFLLSSLTPLYSLADVALPPRALNQMFSDAFAPAHQLTSVDPRVGAYLACGLMVRGDVLMSDIRRNIDRMKPRLNFAYWNQEGWKVGLCATPPIGQKRSLLTLANHTGMATMFDGLRARFLKLYARKVYIHHYTKYIEQEAFTQALETVEAMISDYSALESAAPPPVSSGLRVASTF
ncbi:tubulin [Thecamonas trahens ATCC 50062]|uniref:Tubulin n=1 Tax=Thecamonas trahens ATCC 50062 TaxID=461836 RepID=A0A0L0D8Z0_THETB|nr:tubulin [Thecamonas trahens ATCC 50062]KNC48695.1 tubulin [Thecamonas trahens ATCC 50062]|eukprot:XP_013762751.1 tubulin [Thecamonas trahens ATCC 50062]